MPFFIETLTHAACLFIQLVCVFAPPPSSPLSQVNEHFLSLARDLDVVEAKSAEDIYKTHLADGSKARARVPPPAAAGAAGAAAKTVDSAKQNLAASFVNAFVNAGHGKDSLLMTAAGTDGSEWLFKNKDHGILSAAASLGMVMMWDLDNGYSAVDKYMHSKNPMIQAGAVLATGMLSANVTSEMDAGIALLGEYVENANKDVRLSAVVGLGLAYAGQVRDRQRGMMGWNRPVIAPFELDYTTVSWPRLLNVDPTFSLSLLFSVSGPRGRAGHARPAGRRLVAQH